MKAMIWNNKWWIDCAEPTRIKEFLNGLLVESGFGILSFKEHYFKPFGYSGLWLLSESHLAVHTFPEENKAYIELSSCVKKYQKTFTKRFKDIKW